MMASFGAFLIGWLFIGAASAQAIAVRRAGRIRPLISTQGRVVLLITATGCGAGGALLVGVAIVRVFA